MNTDMSAAAKKVVADMLSSYADDLNGSICDDYDLELTAENLELVKAAIMWDHRDNDEFEIDYQHMKIIASGGLIAGYLAALLSSKRPWKQTVKATTITTQCIVLPVYLSTANGKAVYTNMEQPTIAEVAKKADADDEEDVLCPNDDEEDDDGDVLCPDE